MVETGGQVRAIVEGIRRVKLRPGLGGLLLVADLEREAGLGFRLPPACVQALEAWALDWALAHPEEIEAERARRLMEQEVCGE